MRLGRTQAQPIGVDLGHDSVKLVQFEADEDSLRAVAWARESLPSEVRRDTGRWLPAAVELAGLLVRRGGFVGRRAVVCVPREMLHIKHLRLPVMPASELENVVRFESRNLFDFDIQSALVQHIPAGEVRQGGETLQEVLVLAAQVAELEQFTQRLHRAGIQVDSLDAEPCALYRGVERFVRRRDDELEVHVLADIGAAQTSVVIGRGRDIAFYKPIAIGGDRFREAIEQRLSIGPAEAADLRRRMLREDAEGTAAADEPVRQALLDATRSLVEELAGEITLCLRYHSVTFRGQRPAKVRLLGGEARDVRLAERLSAVLNLPVQCGRPLLSVDMGRVSVGEDAGPMCEWAVAMGLGLKRTSGRFRPKDGTPRASVAAPIAPAGRAESAERREVVHA